MRRLYTAGDLVEAHLVLHQLTRAGIAAKVLNTNAAGGLGEIPFTQTFPEVWIEEEQDFDRGRDVVAQHEAAQSRPGTRHCPTCGEENPMTFEMCWGCGSDLVNSGR